MSSQFPEWQLTNEKLNKEITSFFEKNKQFAEKFLKAIGPEEGGTTLKDFLTSVRDPGASYLFAAWNQALSTSDYKKNHKIPSMTLEELDAISPLIQSCINIEKKVINDYIPAIHSPAHDKMYPELVKKQLSLLNKLGADFNKKIPDKDSYPSAFAWMVSDGGMTLDFILSQTSTPLSDETLTGAINLLLSRKGAETADGEFTNLAQKILRYRVDKHSQTGAQGVSKTSADTKVGSDDFLAKWYALQLMDKRKPGFLKNPNNKSLLSETEQGFIKQYGFHPTLSDTDYKKSLETKPKEGKTLSFKGPGSAGQPAVEPNKESSEKQKTKPNK